jgi:hypothetical protein
MESSGQDPSAAAAASEVLARGGVNPFLHFAISEAYATAAAAAVHILSRLMSFTVKIVDGYLPVTDSAPMVFFEGAMAWGGMFATAATFLLITYYQLAVLAKRLYRGIKQ